MSRKRKRRTRKSRWQWRWRWRRRSIRTRGRSSSTIRKHSAVLPCTRSESSRGRIRSQRAWLQYSRCSRKIGYVLDSMIILTSGAKMERAHQLCTRVQPHHLALPSCRGHRRRMQRLKQRRRILMGSTQALLLSQYHPKCRGRVGNWTPWRPGCFECPLAMMQVLAMPVLKHPRIAPFSRQIEEEGTGNGAWLWWQRTSSLRPRRRRRG